MKAESKYMANKRIEQSVNKAKIDAVTENMARRSHLIDQHTAIAGKVLVGLGVFVVASLAGHWLPVAWFWAHFTIGTVGLVLVISWHFTAAQRIMQTPVAVDGDGRVLVR